MQKRRPRDAERQLRLRLWPSSIDDDGDALALEPVVRRGDRLRETLQSMRKKDQLGIYPFTQVHTNVVDPARSIGSLHLTGKTGNLTWIVSDEGLYLNDTTGAGDQQLRPPAPFNAINPRASAAICRTRRVCLKPPALDLGRNCPANYPLVSRHRRAIPSSADLYSARPMPRCNIQLGNFSLGGEATHLATT